MSAGDPEQATRSESAGLRLFRLCGVWPLGFFVLLHTLLYGQVLLGRRPRWTLAVSVAEVVLVLLPLAYHALYGAQLLLTRRAVRTRSGPTQSLLDQVQRWTSVLVLAFVIDHFLRFRLPMWTGEAAPGDAHALLVRALSSTVGGWPAVAAFQLLGVTATAFHLGYGWYRHSWCGVQWLADERRRTWLGAAVGLLVLVAGSLAVVALATGKKLPFL